MNETDTDPSAISAASPGRWDWRRGVRWFGAEFLVVVTGVLVALALNAWWGERQDRDLEQDYLRQLAADVQETRSGFARDDSVTTQGMAIATKAVRAYWLDEPVPTDSLVLWISYALESESSVPVTGRPERS